MSTKPRGLSLHIGVNFVDPVHYGGDRVGRLNACENDGDDMQGIARARGFETSVLTSADAARGMPNKSYDRERPFSI